MDPNANLERQRALATLIIAEVDGEDTNAETLERLADELAGLVQALDEWITNGGFLPDAWQREMYLVRRFYADEQHPDHRKVVAAGLTLEQAQAHCQRDDTSAKSANGEVIWFDGYDRAGNSR